MAYTPVFSQGVKFIKIARLDVQGKDNTLSLQELNSIRIDYSDTDIIEYPIISISKYDDYFLFGVAPTNATSSTDNQILNYRFSGSYSGSYYDPSELVTLDDSVGAPGKWKESYDNLNYFTGSLGRYTLGNLPNIPIKFISSASVTSSVAGNNVSLRLVSNIQGNLSSDTATLGSGATGQLIVSYTGVPQQDEYFYLQYGSTGNNSQFTASYYVTQSVPPTASISDLVVLQPYIDENFYVSDYNVLAGNAVIPRYSELYMDVDYATNIIQAVNSASIIAGTATRAAVQDSNYTDTGWISARYNGTKVSSIDYNTYTPATEYTGSKAYYSFATQQVTIVSDTSIFGYTGSWPGDQAYGKQTSIDIYRNYFAKFINITSSFPVIPGASNIYITELIDINGNRLSLNENQYLLDVAYNFTKDTGVNIYYFANITGSALISSASVIDGGAYYQTILYSTGSLNNYNTSSLNPEPQETWNAYYYKNNYQEKLLPTSLNKGRNAFSASGNILYTVTQPTSSSSTIKFSNWLYPFLTSSFTTQSVTYPLAKVRYEGGYTGVYNINTNTINTGLLTYESGSLPPTYPLSGTIDWVAYTAFQDVISPIKANDYIRLGTIGSTFFGTDANNIQTTASSIYQIIDTNIDTTGNGLYTGSLTVNTTVNSLPDSLFNQAYIIYRRIPSENYVVINKTINLNNEGLLIPANFNPDYDPIAIARRAGVI